MIISVGCLLLAWALFVGQLVNTLKISEWKILQDKPLLLKLVNKASTSRKLFTLPMLFILLLGLASMLFILSSLYELGN